jgi:proteasome lid subunit RPN8/RPN11
MKNVETGAATYRFRLEFWKPGGRCMAEAPLEEADFARAVETAFFDGLRRGLFTEYRLPQHGVRLEPRFVRADSGSPRTRGFDVVLPTPSGEEDRMSFRTRFLSGYTKRAIREMVVSGTLPLNTALLYHLAAYLDETAGQAPRRSGISLDSAAPAVPIRDSARNALGRTEKWDGPSPVDVPVLIPRRVLEEALAEAQRTPDREVGGLLLGHLRRDAETRELFVEITGYVPAEETIATSVSVTFTTATWSRAREVIELRGEGEIFVGWVHSHPFGLPEPCPDPLPPEWPDEFLFFSSEDKFLMELAFPRPFMVGLQTGIEPRLEQALGHAPVRLYGWREGLIVPRGFEVFDD